MSILYPVMAVLLAFACRSQTDKPDDIASEPILKSTTSTSNTQTSTESKLASGHYLGTLNFKSMQISYPLSLSIEEFKSTKNSATYTGVMKISTGGYISSEYIGMYFPEVTSSKSEIQFTSHTQAPLTLKDAKLSGRTIVGIARTKEGEKGTFTLEYFDNANPSASYLDQAQFTKKSQIGGLYVGLCADGQKSLKIETFVDPASLPEAKPNKAISAVAVWVSPEETKPSPKEKSDPIKLSYQKFPKGHVNLLDQSIVLTNDKDTLICNIAGDSLICNDCAYVSQTPENQNSTQITADFSPSDSSFFDSNEDAQINMATHKKSTWSQNYFGVIRHQFLEKLQIGRLKFNPQVEDGKIKAVSAIGNLFFGAPAQNKYIFEEFILKNPQALQKSTHQKLVFEGQGDLFFVVHKWQDKIVNTSWYSKSFGYIGQGVFSPGSIPNPKSKKKRVIDSLNGLFSSKYGRLEIHTNFESSFDQITSSSLSIAGQFIHQFNQKSNTYRVVNGGYNYYLGNFMMSLVGQHWITGRFLANETLIKHTSFLGIEERDPASYQPVTLTKINTSEKRVSAR